MFFASVILHELGHSLVARRHGVGIASITLFVFGGVSEMRDEPRTPRQEFEIAVMGPAISLALAGVLGVVGFLARDGETPTGASVLLLDLAGVNLLLAFFNLLPAFPLDGGRVLRAALWYSPATSWRPRTQPLGSPRSSRSGSSGLACSSSSRVASAASGSP